MQMISPYATLRVRGVSFDHRTGGVSIIDLAFELLATSLNLILYYQIDLPTKHNR